MPTLFSAAPPHFYGAELSWSYLAVCDAGYEKISNISVDGNICCVPHIMFERATVYGLHIRVSVNGNTTLSELRIILFPQS